MHVRRTIRSLFGLALISAAAPCARAQWAVVDVGAIGQLMQEVQALEQQIQLSRQQLASAEQSVHAMTGTRGMESLLSGGNRNYLPDRWTEMSGLATGGSAGPYGSLAGQVRSSVAASAVLTPERLATMSPDDQRLIQSAREWNALHQVVEAVALAHASDRFAALQGLIAAIPQAQDQKAVLDLQARIAAEIGMLENEAIKLQILERATLSQKDLLRQQQGEYAILESGRFETRFRPRVP